MTTVPEPPVGDIVHASLAERRLRVLVRRLGDADMAAPSLLSGWSVAHVMTHLARNADSHRRRAEAAAAGVVVDQYPGGMSERAAQIEEGALRPAPVIAEDVVESASRMLLAWKEVPRSAWAGVTRDASGLERPLVELPGRRWSEAEVHMIDLGLGPTFHDWPDAFVAARLPGMRAGLTARLPAGATAPVPGTMDQRDELAWLYGRLSRPDLPVLGPW